MRSDASWGSRRAIEISVAAPCRIWWITVTSHDVGISVRNTPSLSAAFDERLDARSRVGVQFLHSSGRQLVFGGGDDRGSLTGQEPTAFDQAAQRVARVAGQVDGTEGTFALFEDTHDHSFE